MNIDQTLEQLARLQYPKQVDVTDRVMEQIGDRSPVVSRRWSLIGHRSPATNHRPLWTRISAVAAAAVVVLVAVNVTSLYTRSYDVEGMGSTLAQLNDYSSWTTVEEAANPYEYLYEE